MQRHWAITLGLWVLTRSSSSVAMAPVWVACQRCSALLFNNTEKYFEDPLGEHNTLYSPWSGSVILQLNIVSCYHAKKEERRRKKSPHHLIQFFSIIYFQTYMVHHSYPPKKVMQIKHFEITN